MQPESINNAAEREGERETERGGTEGGGEGQQMAEMILNKQLKDFRQTIKEGKLEELLFRPLFSLACLLRMD